MPHSTAPTRPTTTASETARVAVTELFRRPTSWFETEPPLAVTLCWYCGTADDQLDPPGWVTAWVGSDPSVGAALGVCPACRCTRPLCNPTA